MKKFVMTLVFFCTVSFVQACLLDPVLILLGVRNRYREVETPSFELSFSDQYISYNQKLSELLIPVYDFLLQQQEAFPATKLAVVFDIDDTSFYPQTVMPSSVVFEFFHKLKQSGFTLFFVSARPEAHLEVSMEQLADGGYNDYLALMHLPPVELMRIRQLGAPVLISNEIGRWKASVRVELERNYLVKIVATLDDKQDNLIGDACGIPIWVPTDYSDLVVYVEAFKKAHKEIFSEFSSDAMALDEIAIEGIDHACL